MPLPSSSHRAPLIWLLCPLVTGLICARLWPPGANGTWPLIGAAGLAGLAACQFARRDRAALCLVALALSSGLSGYVLLHLRHPLPPEARDRPPREVTVELTVDTLYRSAPRALSLSGLGVISDTPDHERELAGRLVYFSALRRVSAPPRLGATYRVRGVVETFPDAPQEGFDDYLANLGIRHRLVRARLIAEVAAPGRLGTALADLRGRLEEILGHGLRRHPETAGLYRAMLLGEKASLSAAQESAFLNSGTFHVFSVSGLHVGVIATALLSLTNALRLPLRLGVSLTLGVLWLYVLVTGTGVPSVRAFIMIAFMQGARALRLPGNAFSALVAAALCTLLVDPWQLFSTGFQLSYTVVAALILLGSPLAQRWTEHWHPYALVPRPQWRWWHEAVTWAGRAALTAVAGCWAAFLASLAATVGNFGVLSPGSLPANLLILPLSSLAIVAGLVSLLVGLAGVLSWSALFNAAAAMLIIAAEWLLREGMSVPGVYFPASFRAAWLSPVAVIAMTAVLLAGAGTRWAKRWGGFWPPVVLVAILLLFGVKIG